MWPTMTTIGKPCFMFSVSITSQVVSRGGWDRGTFAEMFKNMCCGPVHKNMEGHLELQANLCIFDASWPSQSRGPCDQKQRHTTRWYTLVSRPWVRNVYGNMEVHLELQLQVNLCILDASWPSLSCVIKIGPIKPVDIGCFTFVSRPWGLSPVSTRVLDSSRSYLADSSPSTCGILILSSQRYIWGRNGRCRSSGEWLQDVLRSSGCICS